MLLLSHSPTGKTVEAGSGNTSLKDVALQSQFVRDDGSPTINVLAGECFLATSKDLEYEKLDETQPIGSVTRECISGSDCLPESRECSTTLPSDTGSKASAANTRNALISVDVDDRCDCPIVLKARVESAVKEQLVLDGLAFDLVDISGRVIQSNADIWRASSSSSGAPIRAIPSEDAVELLDQCSDELQELRQRFVTEKLAAFERKIEAIVSDVAKERSSRDVLEARLIALMDERMKASIASLEDLTTKLSLQDKILRRDSQKVADLQKDMILRFDRLEARTERSAPASRMEVLLAEGGRQDDDLRRESQRITDLQKLLVTQSHSLASLSSRQSSNQAILNYHAEALRAQELKITELRESLRFQGERLSETVCSAMQKLEEGEASAFSTVVDKLGALAERFPRGICEQKPPIDSIHSRPESPHLTSSKSCSAQVAAGSGSHTVGVGRLRNALSLSALPQTMPTATFGLRDQEKTCWSGRTPPRVTNHRNALSPSRATWPNHYGNVHSHVASSPRYSGQQVKEANVVRPAQDQMRPLEVTELSTSRSSIPRSNSAPGIVSPSQMHSRRVTIQNGNRAAPRQITVEGGMEVSPRMLGQGPIQKATSISRAALPIETTLPLFLSSMST